VSEKAKFEGLLVEATDEGIFVAFESLFVHFAAKSAFFASSVTGENCKPQNALEK
jgi:hypothetical protein